MKRKQQSAADDAPLEPPLNGAAVMQSLSLLALNSLKHNWLSKADEAETLAACFAELEIGLKQVREITLRLVGGSLTLNGQEVDTSGAPLSEFRELLTRRGIDNFTFLRGMTAATLRDLMEILTADPAALEQLGGFARVLATCGIEHVIARNILYREVTEDDVILSRQALEAASRESDQSKDVKDRVTSVADILGQLKVDGESPIAAVVRELQDMADDASRLADVVMQAALERRDEAEDQARETLAGAIMKTVRRTFETLLNDPAARTQKGKKRLQRQLRALEEELLGLVGKLGHGEQAPARQAVREAVERIDDEIRIDALAGEYMKRLKAVEKTEKRLMRYMKDKDPASLPDSELATRLRADGLEDDRLRRLLQRGPGGDGPGGGSGNRPGGSGGGITMERLGELLSRMEKMVSNLAQSPDRQQRETFSGVLHQVSHEIGHMVADSTRRVEQIASDIHADAEAARKAEAVAREQGIGLRVTRARMLAMISELNQELTQPLAVINCSMDMILTGRLGEISETQRNMLNLIAESAARLGTLIGGLEKIAGVPDAMAPDRTLIDAVAAAGKKNEAP